MNCTMDEDCGWNSTYSTPGSAMKCISVDGLGVCSYDTLVLENGAFCALDSQCLPTSTGAGQCALGNFSNITVCNPNAALVGESCALPGDCAPQTWCDFSSGAGLCAVSLAANADCSGGQALYANVPNYLCPPGYGCLQTSASLDTPTYACTKYYSQAKDSKKQAAVCNVDEWWNCEYSYYCTANHTSLNNTIGRCTLINQVSTVGTSCKTFPLTMADYTTCLWGTTCDCFLSQNVSAGSCERLYNTNCASQLQSLTSCIVKNKCPHDPRQLIGGSSDPFLGSILAGSCIHTNCLQPYDNMIYCQNLDINNYRSPAFVPTAGPNSHFNNKNPGLAGWEIGLIIVGISVAVIIIVVVVVAVVRRRSKSDYQPLE